MASTRDHTCWWLLHAPSTDITLCSPICSRTVPERNINSHLDNNCSDHDPSKIAGPPGSSTRLAPEKASKASKQAVAPIFNLGSSQKTASSSAANPSTNPIRTSSSYVTPKKRAIPGPSHTEAGPSKRTKTSKLSLAAPLAERLRPQSLDEFVGQSHLTGHDSLLMNLVRTGSIGSLVLWGPPGYARYSLKLKTQTVLTCLIESCGKTTLARLLARAIDAAFKELSATDSGISDVRAVAEEAKGLMNLTGR